MNMVTEHISVMKAQAIQALSIHPEGIYVDATFGRGGHSRAILQQLSPKGKLFAFDRDPQAILAGRELQDERLHLIHAPFSALSEKLKECGVTQIHGVLFDLGVSSPQLDQAERGMSFRLDGPLDMRMDTTRGITVAEWLATAEQEQIKEVIKNYGEERFATAIAKAIAIAREREPIVSTRQLAQIVEKTVHAREPGKHPATRSFQALRIFINQELEELEQALPQALEHLVVGGRLVVISFHSLEDRIVKRFMRNLSRGEQLPRCIPVRADQLATAQFKLIGRARCCDAEERLSNSRARSAVMRVLERISLA